MFSSRAITFHLRQNVFIFETKSFHLGQNVFILTRILWVLPQLVNWRVVLLMERRAQALFKSKKLESNNFYNCTILLTATLWIKFLLFPWKWAFSIVLTWPEKCKNVIYKHNYQLFTLKILFEMTTLSKICSKFPYSSLDLIVQIINLCVRVVGMQGEFGRGSVAWQSWDEKYKGWKTNKKTHIHNMHIIMHTHHTCIQLPRSLCIKVELSWRGGVGEDDAKIQRQEDKYKPCKHVMYGDLGRGNGAALHGR